MDELERRIRQARPLSGHRNLPLSDRAKRELADIILDAPVPETFAAEHGRGGFPRRAAIIIGISAAVAVAAVLATGQWLAPAPTVHAEYAATPPLLVVTPLQTPAAELLDEMSQLLSGPIRHPHPDDAVIHVETWTLDVDVDGLAASRIVVPEIHEITLGADGSRRSVVTAGRPTGPDGKPRSSPEAVQEGDLLREESWPPDQYPYLFRGAFPVDESDVGAYLAHAHRITPPLSAADAIEATQELLLEQKLVPEQASALLRYLAGLPDLKAVGEVTDRKGRSGILFTAETAERPGYEQQLIVSPDTGQVLGIEVVYTADSRRDIPSPAVVSYSSWW